MKGWVVRLNWMLCLALLALALLSLRFFFYFVSFFEQLVRLWLGT